MLEIVAQGFQQALYRHRRNKRITCASSDPQPASIQIYTILHYAGVDPKEIIPE